MFEQDPELLSLATSANGKCVCVGGGHDQHQSSDGIENVDKQERRRHGHV